MLEISIIVPVYNVEPYIEKCLDSILNQEDPGLDYEVIVVDDGSQDRSLETVERFASNHPNMRVIRQPNRGLSAARNKGIELAAGKFVWCVDSDDWIDRKSLSMLAPLLRNDTVDAIAIVAADVVQGHAVPRFDRGDYAGGIYAGAWLMRKGIWSCCVPFTVYRRRFLADNNLWQKIGIYHEDSEFSPRAYYTASNVYVSDCMLYFVRRNPHSITRSVNPKKSFDLLFVAESLDRFTSDSVERKDRAVFHKLIANAINGSLRGAGAMDNGLKEAFFGQLQANRRYWIPHFLRTGSAKYITEGILFSLFPTHIAAIYRVLRCIYGIRQ